jgi:beta-N-acetylhexosaminidase
MVKIELARAIEKHQHEVESIEIPFRASEAEIQEALRRAAAFDHVIVGTIAADKDASQAALVNALVAQGRAPAVVALRTPYDLVRFPDVPAYLCVYSIRPAAIEAAARVLLGEQSANGVLPCQLPGALPV